MTKEGVCWYTIKCRHLKKFNLWGGDKLKNFSTTLIESNLFVNVLS